jgi:hypothetical protein
MDDKLKWMYGFWILLSGAKSVQAIGRLIGYHQAHVPPPADRVVLTFFWTTALCFYGYALWRNRVPGASPDGQGKLRHG